MSVVKLQYQLKRQQQEVENWKRKAKAREDDFVALQQGVTNKQKQMQQRINRLEQEVLELRRVRDVLTRDYQESLQQRLDLVKSDDKAALLGSSVEKLTGEVASLRQALEEANAKTRDWEAQALAAEHRADLLVAERDAARREADAALAAAKEQQEEEKNGE